MVGLPDGDIDGIEAELKTHGLAMDDVSFAVGGRTSPDDRPYFVIAVRFKGMPADSLAEILGIPDGFPADHPEGVLVARTFDGKAVLVGDATMIDQSEHARGVPYIYNVDDVRFMVVTDDPGWAEDALRQLP